MTTFPPIQPSPVERFVVIGNQQLDQDENSQFFQNHLVTYGIYVLIEFKTWN